MLYTTHGLMTLADMGDVMDLYDLRPEPTTLGDLAKAIGATPSDVAAFGNLSDYRADSLVSAGDADDIRQAWLDAEANRRDNPAVWAFDREYDA